MPGVEGRVALVTGVGRGIWRATADLLASRGARVMAVAHSENELQTLGLDYVVADLGTPDGCKLAVEKTQDRLGPVAILVYNHGIGSAHERVIWKQEPELWRETMRINLDGPYFLSRIVVKDMVEQGYGRLVFTSSTAGQVAEYAGSIYNSSKHGLLGLMRSVAQDAGPHSVTSNAVLCPAGCEHQWLRIRPKPKPSSMVSTRMRCRQKKLRFTRRHQVGQFMENNIPNINDVSYRLSRVLHAIVGSFIMMKSLALKHPTPR